MIVWGINALNHDASIAIIEDDRIVWHKTSAEFTGERGCSVLTQEMVDKALSVGKPEHIYWYEQPLTKKIRQVRAGQYQLAFDKKEMPKTYLKTFGLDVPITYTPHHGSHAAAGFYTTQFDEAAVVVLDAIGEWETASIWYGQGNELKKLWSQKYPTSLGLFYSAFTQLVGLRPTKDEHIFQGLSLKGDPMRYRKEIMSYWNLDSTWTMTKNLHCGVYDWPYEIKNDQDKYDIAAAVQKMFEVKAQEVVDRAKFLTKSENLVYMGGCALNTKFNDMLPPFWKGLWSLPNPGDASSSLGAILYNKKMRVRWEKEFATHIKIKY